MHDGAVYVCLFKKGCNKAGILWDKVCMHLERPGLIRYSWHSYVLEIVSHKFEFL